MDLSEADKQVKLLTAGFESLQDEYQTLFARHQALERQLAKTREQYNELAKLYGTGAVSSPPLSLSSSPGNDQGEAATTPSVAGILEDQLDASSKDAATKVRAGSKAANYLRRGLAIPAGTPANGVRIWSGPSADRPDPGGSMMPSISESPLEQDFTVQGKPSNLGCPFASMANKRLSPHAASVLNRYNQGSAGSVSSTPIGSVNRLNGKESLSEKANRRESFVDPIKAEVCGFSALDEESPHSERAMKDYLERQESTEAGVCPIRFLDQHSPEEVATYFQKHKHELPRSHEICVKRYQSNEKQIQELDTKYGSLVSMIQGLGAKHKDMLPKEPEDGGVATAEDAKSTEKVRKWASNVSGQAGDIEHGDGDGDVEERQPHFERPLRDIRVGESPSRPWGIRVPAKYQGQDDGQESGKPAHEDLPTGVKQGAGARTGKPGQCPLGFDTAQEPAKDAPAAVINTPIFVGEEQIAAAALHANSSGRQSQMVFTGPVFLGYSVDDAVKILRESGLRAP